MSPTQLDLRRNKLREWLQDLLFFTDIMNHLEILNLAFQSKDHLVSNLFEKMFSFQK